MHISKVSNRYMRIETTDLLSNALSELGTNYQIRTIKSNNKTNTTERVEVKFPDYGYTDPTGSLIVPMVIIKNSYNGECSLTVNTGLYRQVCSNGLMVATTKDLVGRIVHLKTYKEQVKELEYKIAAFLGSLNEQKDILNRLDQTKLTQHQALTLVGKLEFSKQLTKRIQQSLLVPSRDSDRGNSLYNVWNIVNEQMRKKGRSESAQVEKNIGLLEKLIKLAA